MDILFVYTSQYPALIIEVIMRRMLTGTRWTKLLVKTTSLILMKQKEKETIYDVL